MGPKAVDPRFHAARARSQSRRRFRVLRLAGGLALVSGVLAAGLYGMQSGGLPQIAFGPRPAVEAEVPHTAALTPAADVTPATQAAAEPAPDPAPDTAAMDAFLDIPGDPLRLQFGTANRLAARSLPPPEGLDPGRGSGPIIVLQDVMVSTEDRLVTALPSSREDFAIFQAQRRGLPAATPVAATPALADPTLADPDALDPQAPGDAADDTPPQRLRTATEAAAFFASRGAGGHNRLPIRPTEVRTPLTEDSILRITTPRALADILSSAGLAPEEAAHVASEAAAQMGLETPDTGHVVALRIVIPPGGNGVARFAQLAHYAGGEYVGALARDDPPGNETAPLPALVPAADPWLGADLLRLAARSPQAASPTQFRVLDAFYSAALRNRLPTGLVGEIIMLLSEAHDLDAFAEPGDRMIVVRSSDPPADPAAPALGQVLYVGIEGASAQIRCYVHPRGPGLPHACYGISRGAAALPAGDAREGITGSDAVEQLVDRIIQVESAGVADARNPLSTATGLGQFIESTWVRMMRTYRPDLFTTLPRAELLALRTDPAISRQMVTELAREGESYLRARGHEITAGRLYLAHFLGMEGAHLVLSTPPEAALVQVLGEAVIRANPFLTGHDVAYVVGWAEDKMRSRGGRTTVIREPAGLAALRRIVDEVLRAG